MLTNYLLTAAILAASAGVSETPTEIVPQSSYYPEIEDTSSFGNAYELSYDELEYAEVFGVNDTFDYVKYTATYTRNVYFSLYATDNKIATVYIYISSRGLTTPVQSYSSNESINISSPICVKQGETVYFKVKCTGNCWWTGTLDLDPHPSGFEYYGYEIFNGYTMPHTGPATIHYAYDSSCYQNVPEQDFTYASCLNEAIEIWESCGNIDFVYSESFSHFKVKIQDVSSIEVYHQKPLLSSSYYTTEFNIPNRLSYFDAINYGKTNWDGTDVTIRQAVLGVAIAGFGVVLGLSPRVDLNARYNMMYYPIQPYGGSLGDSDIASFIRLWGDANAN